MDEYSSDSESCAYDSSSDVEGCEGSSVGKQNTVKPLQIVVKRVGNGEMNTLSLELDPSSSVLDLKNQISQQLAATDDEVPADRQRLIYFGRMLLDNNEVLGCKGIKMQSESINYIHLNPLPEGAKPSKRNSRSPSNAVEAARESLQSHIERARRLGTGSRERRRRRRSQPYSAARNQRERSVAGDEAEDPEASIPLPVPSGLHNLAQAQLSAFAVPMMPHHLPLADSHLFQLPTGFPMPPFGPPPPTTLANIAHLSAAVAAVTREAQAATSMMQSQLTDQALQASADLLPSLTSLQDQLRRIRSSSSEEHEINEAVTLLDRVSRDTGALSLALRAAASPQVAATTPHHITSSVTLEQLLTENMRNREMLFPEGAPLFLPGQWPMF